MLFLSTPILSHSLVELYGNLWHLEEHLLAQTDLLDAGSATALRLRPLGLAAAQPRAAPEAGRLLDQAGLLTLGLCRAGAAGFASDRMSAAQPHAQQRVLLRPRVRHVGLLASSCRPLKRTWPGSRARPCRSSSQVAAARAATRSGRLASLLLGRRDGRGRHHRLHHLEVVPGERRRALEAGAQELALDAGDLVPSDSPGQSLKSLDVAAGLLLHKLREDLANLGGTLGRAPRHRALDLKGGTGRLLRELDAATGRVLGPVHRLARHLDALVGSALAEFGDVVGGLLGLVVPGDLRHVGFPLVRFGPSNRRGRAALCWTIHGSMLHCSKRVPAPKSDFPRPANHRGPELEATDGRLRAFLGLVVYQLCKLQKKSRMLLSITFGTPSGYF